MQQEIGWFDCNFIAVYFWLSAFFCCLCILEKVRLWMNDQIDRGCQMVMSPHRCLHDLFVDSSICSLNNENMLRLLNMDGWRFHWESCLAIHGMLETICYYRMAILLFDSFLLMWDILNSRRFPGWVADATALLFASQQWEELSCITRGSGAVLDGSLQRICSFLQCIKCIPLCACVCIEVGSKKDEDCQRYLLEWFEFSKWSKWSNKQLWVQIIVV